MQCTIIQVMTGQHQPAHLYSLEMSCNTLGGLNGGFKTSAATPKPRQAIPLPVEDSHSASRASHFFKEEQHALRDAQSRRALHESSAHRLHMVPQGPRSLHLPEPRDV
jgi:hypothetical protein